MSKPKRFNGGNFTFSTVISLAALFVLAAAFIISNVLFTTNLKKDIRQTSNLALEEVSKTVAGSVDARVEGALSKLNMCAKSYADLAYRQNDEQSARAYLQDSLKESGFARFLIAAPDGGGWATDGGETVNVASLDVFRRAVSGGAAVSGKTASVVDGNKNIIMYAVRIDVDGKFAGVLMSSHTNADLKALLDVSTFDGKGYFYLFVDDGDFVFASDYDSTLRETNFYEMIELRGSVDGEASLETVKTDLAARRGGVFYYTAASQPTASYYMPLSSCNWRIIFNVPLKVMDALGSAAISGAVTISVVTAALFLLIAVYMALVQGSSRRKLMRAAYSDTLTGGMNNTRFEMEAEKLIKSAPPLSYAYVLFNLRQFKLLNNTFGKSEGDRLIRYVYRSLKSALFEGELVSRMSADKFNLLMRYTSQDDLRHRLDAAVKQINSFNDLRSFKYFITASSLIYVIDDNHTTVTQARDYANVMKISGGSSLNTCLFYSNADRVKLLKEKAITDRMEQALKNGDFIVYYQPKYTAADERLAGAEALVRWKELDKLTPPSCFIPVFERNGFIIKLDLFVFKKACQFLQRLKDENKRLLPISVNLSRRHLEDKDFLKPYAEIFSAFDFPPEYLDFEITESLAIENSGMLIDALKEIHRRGFTCSIDDFGSGYSSLNIIKDLEIDTLKIDKQFFDVTNKDDTRGASIVETIIDLAKKLNLSTVAEGVETKEQVAFLKDAGCDLIQGYVFSRPVPEEDFYNVFTLSETLEKEAAETAPKKSPAKRGGNSSAAKKAKPAAKDSPPKKN